MRALGVVNLTRIHGRWWKRSPSVLPVPAFQRANGSDRGSVLAGYPGGEPITMTTSIIILCAALLILWTGMAIGFKLGVQRGKEDWYS